MTRIEGPLYPEEHCDHCNPIGTFGLAHPDDPRYLGTPMSDGLLHDPCRHEDGCPAAMMERQNQSVAELS